MIRVISRIIISENLAFASSGNQQWSIIFFTFILSLVKYFMKNVFAITSVLSENIQHTTNELILCKYIQFFLFQAVLKQAGLYQKCVTKATIKNVHFCTELRKVAALVATSTCLISCCKSSSAETTAGNSVTKMIIESCLSTQRVAQIGFSFCREEAEPETSLKHFLEISIRAVQNATEKRICPIQLPSHF